MPVKLAPTIHGSISTSGGNSSVANDWFRAQTAQVRSWQLERMSNGGGLEGHGTVTESQDSLLYLSLITCPMKRLRRYCRCAVLTAYNGLVRSRSPKGEDYVLALGTDDVPTFAVGIALASGANVIATSSSDEKLGVKIKASCFADWRQRVDYVSEVGRPNVLQKSNVDVEDSGWARIMGFVPGIIYVKIRGYELLVRSL
ncbi:hypothetical protein F5J12DRAFT_783711 [Pisolithus orientalis]|uniref:uncharacterized protein n=1 Tax=Pisolithus orientalis TaxID=936130 RepID=UPI0022242678|nr:uncharacterized protein F5J12DRAFT_783711 [Pisolithus orientalis]KAI6003292.1 hypothetical protein F5J12DRAFT_783711 [Pisolithus orientalis]